MRWKRGLNAIAVAFTAMVVVFGVLEAAARFVVMHTSDVDRFLTYASTAQLQKRPDALRPSRYTAHRYLGYLPAPNFYAPKVNNRHNSLGYRDDEIALPKPAGEFRIACLGGSTTYTPCVGDYRYSYPNCVERELRARGYGNVNVINAAADGWTSYETLINLAFRVLDLEPDLIVVLDSINDVWARIVWPHEAYHGDNSGFRAPQAPRMTPFYEYSTVIRGVLIKLGKATPHSWLAGSLDTWHGDTFHGMEYESQVQRGTYPDGVFREADLGTMLRSNPPVYFRRNLKNIVSLAQANGVKVVLATLPMSVDAGKREGARPLTGSPDFVAALDETNAIVKEVGAELGCAVFDFAAAFPKDPKYYQDGLHVNFDGVQLMGKCFADFLESAGLVPGPITPR